MMKSTGIVRQLDDLGRLVIPKEIRNRFDIKSGDSLEIFIEGDRIILRKYQPACIFCDNAKDIINYKGKNICPDCIRAMPSEQLRSEILARFSLPVQSAKRVESGISLALETCRETDAICIFGSLYQAGAAREFFKSRGKPPV